MEEKSQQGDAVISPLVAAILSQSVADASYVTNALLASKDQDIELLSRAYLALFKGVAQIPEMTRTAYLDRLLDQGSSAYGMAMHHLNGVSAT